MARTGLERAIRVAMVMLLGAACSTTRYVGPTVTPESVDVIRGENPGAPIAIEGVVPPAADVPGARQSLKLTLVETSPTETVVKEGWSSAQFSVKNQEIRGLTITDHARGALQGAAVGALAAAVLVGIVELAGAPCDSCLPRINQLDAGERAGIFVGVPIVLLTTGLGAIAGANTTYSFQ
ncbi:MAG TPA: hypothetical protein VHL80_11120 [Polyangia bacterium]|nr:hypothetical protein [Polyangia bacterium]